MQGQSIRVVVADDSAVVRRLLIEALAQDAEIEIVASVRNGAEAVKSALACLPDLVLLDVEMPIMDGIEAVAAIRKMLPLIPIIMFSAITTNGGEATLDALSAGANDFVTKPSHSGHLGDSLKFIREELLPKVKMWGRRSHRQGGSDRRTFTSKQGAVSRKPLTVPAVSVVRPARTGEVSASADIVAIGSSTGGPDALSEVLARLPDDLSVPILIAQHMPPTFTRLLAERLDKVSRLQVREGVEGVPLEPGAVWVAPGNFHMTVRRDGAMRVLHLDQNERENSCRPAVDSLFRSVAEVYGSRSLGVVLTGMGHDGTKGSSAIKKAGGRVIVQDEPSCVVWGMPRSVAVAGHADRVLPLKEIALEIEDSVRRDLVRTAIDRSQVTP